MTEIATDFGCITAAVVSAGAFLASLRVAWLICKRLASPQPGASS